MAMPGSPLEPGGHAPHVAHGDAFLARGAQDHGLDLGGAVELAHRADAVLAAAQVHVARRDVDVLGLQGGDHLGDGQAEGGHAHGVDLHVHLALGAAAHEEVGHALDAFDVLADLVLEKGAVAGDVALVAGQEVEHAPDHGGGGAARGRDDGLVRVLRVGGHLVELVGHPSPPGRGCP